MEYIVVKTDSGVEEADLMVKTYLDKFGVPDTEIRVMFYTEPTVVAKFENIPDLVTAVLEILKKNSETGENLAMLIVNGEELFIAFGVGLAESSIFVNQTGTC
jgi:ABC-type histidine transport system ATPase subunit